MASNLRVDTILPSSGTNVAIGTASGTVSLIGDSNLTTSGNLTIGGNLGVGGTLTYEDVTNIDSVGVITGRSNINCTSGRFQRGSATVQDGDAIAGGININGTDMDASVIMSVFGNDGDFTRISGSKSRNASVGSHTIVQNNDVLLSLKGFGSDGTNFEEAAQIEMQVDGSPGNDDMPGRIVFKTTADGASSPTERLRIASVGDIAIGGCAVNTFNNYQTLTIGGARAVDGVGIDLERSDGNIYGRFFGDANGVQIGAPQSDDYIRFETQNTERARIQGGGLKLNGGSYIMEVSAGHGAPNNNNKQLDQRRWMWYGSSSSTHTVARVAKAAGGQPGDGDSQLAAFIVTYTARTMYSFNSDGGYSVMKMRTGRFNYNNNTVHFSTEQDTMGTGSGSQNPTIVFTDEGSGVVRISITNPSSTHSFGEINLMTYDCRITLPTG